MTPAAPPAQTAPPKQGSKGSQTGRRIRLENVPLGDALKVILRGEGLDYRVEGNYIFVSTPEILRKEAPGPMETRFYELDNIPDAFPGADVRPVALGPPQGSVR